MLKTAIIGSTSKLVVLITFILLVISASGVHAKKCKSKKANRKCKPTSKNMKSKKNKCCDGEICSSNGFCVFPNPTSAPTLAPVIAPTAFPIQSPTFAPVDSPIAAPVPVRSPTGVPTHTPTNIPTKAPTKAPTKGPTKEPTEEPTKEPTNAPTMSPTNAPVVPTPTSRPTTSYCRVNTAVCRRDDQCCSGRCVRRAKTGRKVCFKAIPETSPTSAPVPVPSQARTSRPTTLFCRVNTAVCVRDDQCCSGRCVRRASTGRTVCFSSVS